MTAKEFYGTDWKTMDQARNQVLQAIRAGQRRPRRPGAVLYTTSRIKSPESACRKLRQRGLPATAQAALTRIRDAVGVRVICAFQPHTYTRTKALFPEFVQVLQQPDITFLAEIFAAREKNEVGITSQDLADAVPGAKVAKDFEELTNWLYDLAQPGDLILTVGAGDIYTVGEALVRRGQESAT